MEDTVLLEVARKAITATLEHHHVDVDIDDDALKEQGAVFVTLTQNDALRGCIGSLVAYRPLIEDLIGNAQAAAFEDPRFLPLTAQELPLTKIEVSVLSTPKTLPYQNWNELRDKITPLEDGVILRLGNHQATFLPQVWEQLPDFEDFFQQLAQKAGIRENVFDLHPDIEVYQVRKIKES